MRRPLELVATCLLIPLIGLAGQHITLDSPKAATSADPVDASAPVDTAATSTPPSTTAPSMKLGSREHATPTHPATPDAPATPAPDQPSSARPGTEPDPVGAVPGAAPSATPALDSAPRIVTIADNDAAWLVEGTTSQWIEPECRRGVEATAGPVDVVPWSELEHTSDRPTRATCDEVLLLLGSPVPGPVPEPPPAGGESPRLDRGINLAGDFEVEPRGSWGSPIAPEDIETIADAGFDHVRIPVRWSSHTGPAPDFAIDETFASEVDALVERALAAGLTVVVDVHHFEELDASPRGERGRLLAIWRQLAERYRDHPPTLVFELLNEPIGAFTDDPSLWNELARETLTVIRETNPSRTVIIGPVEWNHPSRLDDLELPDDPNLVATIHVYDPAEFTVQGAPFIEPRLPTGVTWNPTRRRLALDWRAEPWGATATGSEAGLTVEFEGRYTAMAAVPLETPEPATEVRFTVDAPFDAVVLCNYLDGEATEVPLTWDAGEARGDTRPCGPIDSLAIQTHEQSTPVVVLSSWVVCSVTCEELIVSEANALTRVVDEAATWASTRGVPLYLGEFGTFDAPGAPIDPTSRTAWTRTLREAAESNGIGWAYFEFGNEFGAWDRGARLWRPELLTALLD